MMIDFLMFDPPLRGNHLKLPHKAHALSDVASAARAGADYLTLGPIFVTVSKPGYGPALASARWRGRRSKGSAVMALGRVAAGTARACLDVGATGIAVMGETMRSADPGESTRESSRR
jgi:thiamine-phosphate pyrophosphorylase